MSEQHILEGDTRFPVAGHLNYPPGAGTPDPLIPMGPSGFGEPLWPVTIERTPERTRIGFSYIGLSVPSQAFVIEPRRPRAKGKRQSRRASRR